MTDRVFLDANVLFSAAWLEDAGLTRLWRLDAVDLLSSRVALAEAERNLETEAQRSRLHAPVNELRLVDAPANAALPKGTLLAAKDIPILLAALEARATHLLTGDRKHFGHLYGSAIAGMRIMTPAMYLQSRQPQSPRM